MDKFWSKDDRKLFIMSFIDITLEQENWIVPKENILSYIIFYLGETHWKITQTS